MRRLEFRSAVTGREQPARYRQRTVRHDPFKPDILQIRPNGEPRRLAELTTTTEPLTVTDSAATGVTTGAEAPPFSGTSYSWDAPALSRASTSR